MAHAQSKPAEPTPVDDVRRVRERLDRDAAGNIHTLGERSRAAVEKYRKSLGLKVVATPAPRSSKQ